MWPEFRRSVGRPCVSPDPETGKSRELDHVNSDYNKIKRFGTILLWKAGSETPRSKKHGGKFTLGT